MTEFSNIDEQFRSGQGDWEGQPSDAAWNKLTDRLEDNQTNALRRRRRIYRMTAAASVAALMTISIYMFNNSFEANGFHAQQVDLEVPEHKGLEAKPAMSDALNVRTTEAETADYSTIESSTTESTVALSRNRLSEDRGGDRNGNEDYSMSVSKIDQRKNDVVENIATESLDEVIVKSPGQERSQNNMQQAENDFDNPEESAAYFHDGEGVTGFTPSTNDNANTNADEYIVQEPEMLTETVVANAMGIESAKEDHEKRSSKDDKNREKKTIVTKSEKTSRESGSGSYKAAYTETGDRTEDYTSTVIIILIPLEDQSSCKFLAFEVRKEIYYIDRCQNDKFDLLKTESMPIDHAQILKDLHQYDREYIRGLEKQSKSGPCLPTSKSVQLIYRTSTALSYFEETIRLPMQEFCLPDEAKTIVAELKALRDGYVK